MGSRGGTGQIVFGCDVDGQLQASGVLNCRGATRGVSDVIYSSLERGTSKVYCFTFRSLVRRWDVELRCKLVKLLAVCPIMGSHHAGTTVNATREAIVYNW